METYEIGTVSTHEAFESAPALLGLPGRSAGTHILQSGYCALIVARGHAEVHVYVVGDGTMRVDRDAGFIAREWPDA